MRTVRIGHACSTVWRRLRLTLIDQRNGDHTPGCVAGTENFYAITRYNWSSDCAMAVIELGQAMAECIGR